MKPEEEAQKAEEEAQKAIEQLEASMEVDKLSADLAFRDIQKKLNLSPEALKIVNKWVTKRQAEDRALDEKQRKRGD